MVVHPIRSTCTAPGPGSARPNLMRTCRRALAAPSLAMNAATARTGCVPLSTKSATCRVSSACASREDPQRADPAAHGAADFDARDATRCGVAEHVGDRVERAARLQYDSD